MSATTSIADPFADRCKPTQALQRESPLTILQLLLSVTGVAAMFSQAFLFPVRVPISPLLYLPLVIMSPLH